jgi:hypothetical protein
MLKRKRGPSAGLKLGWILAVVCIATFPVAVAVHGTDSARTTVTHASDDVVYWAVIITTGAEDRDANDVCALTKVLTDNGWDVARMLWLNETAATKTAVLTVPFEWLVHCGADANDVILFFFSMHGDQIDDRPPLDEPDGRDEYLVPFDYDPDDPATAVFDDELSDSFASVASRHIAVIFEACHSGGMVDGTADLQGSGRVILMSASVTETSGSSLLLKRWLFPIHVTRGLAGAADGNGDGWVTAEESFYFARLPTTVHSLTTWLMLLLHPGVSPHLQHPQMADGYPSYEDAVGELPLVRLDR